MTEDSRACALDGDSRGAFKAFAAGERVKGVLSGPNHIIYLGEWEGVKLSKQGEWDRGG